MSTLNNKNTLFHYGGNIWLTKPNPAIANRGNYQTITVCLANGDEFYAVETLELSPNGVYHKRGRPIGQLEDAVFAAHIQKLSPSAATSALWDEVCRLYKNGKPVAQLAGELGISKGRAQRILITRGLYTSALSEQAAWLYDDGRGKRIAEIAKLLGVSETTVQNNLPYRQKQ